MPVLITTEGPLRLLTLNTPQRRNALSRATIAALHAAINEAGADPSIRIILIAGNGPAFSAGHDLKEITAARTGEDNGKAFFTTLMAECAAMMLAIRDCGKPVIAAIEGIATAAGCQLIATCDLAIAGADARFATPGVNIGLFCSTPMVALSRNVSNKHAMEMLLTGEMIDAETAQRFGLINRVVAAGEAVDSARAIALTIAAKPAATLRIGKEAFYHQREMPLDAAYAYASEVMVSNMLHNDAIKGICDFLEKK